MHVPTHITLTIISDHEVLSCYLCMSVLNCYSNFTAYTKLVNPYRLVFMALIKAKAMPTNHTDYSSYIKAVACLTNYMGSTSCHQLMCMRMHTHTHIHTHTHTHSYTLTCTHTYTHTHVHMHTLTHMHAHSHACTLTHTHMHAHAHTSIHTHMHAHSHTCMHTHTHTHSHACTRALTHHRQTNRQTHTHNTHT